MKASRRIARNKASGADPVTCRTPLKRARFLRLDLLRNFRLRHTFAEPQLCSSPAPPDQGFSPPSVRRRASSLPSETKLLPPGGAPFIAADLLAIWIVGFLGLILRFHLGAFEGKSALNYPIPLHIGFLLLHSGLIVLLCDTQRLYSRELLSSRAEMIAIARSVGIATVILTGVIYGSGITSLSRLVIVFTMLSSLAALAGWRYANRRWVLHSTGKGYRARNVLIIGNGGLAQSVRSYLQRHSALGFHVVDPGDDPGPSPAVLSLARTCRAHFVDQILICSHDRALVESTIAEASAAGITVRVIPEFYGGFGWNTPIDYLGKIPAMSIYSKHKPVFALKLKSALDIAGAFLGLVVTAPLLMVLAIWIKCDSKGSVFYTSRRVGKKARPFGCHKLRTMVQDAEHRRETMGHLNERDGVLFKISADPRITSVGRWLRKYSLDEIPQLWNVLKGEMSLVGPRPPLANEVAQYQLEYLRRLDVSPGITGLWQVEARENPSFDRYIEFDLKYVEDWSFSLDLKILAKTLAVVVAGSGQ